MIPPERTLAARAVHPGSHPRDIAQFALACHHAGTGVALVFVTAVEGGGVRMPGLRMAVDAQGAVCGYISNGCIEADVVASARRAIAERRPIAVAYGRGSDKLDLVLPCGGRIELLIVPLDGMRPRLERLECLARSRRSTGFIVLARDGAWSWQQEPQAGAQVQWRFAVHPKIRLLVIGTGTEALCLASQAVVADMEVELVSPDERTTVLAAALEIPVVQIRGLSSDLSLNVDTGTAIALMFHDHEWELGFLPEALAGPAFYVGALGSVRAHAQRAAALRAAGCSQQAIDRLRGPIGLVPRLRDPNLLAVSVLAEIAEAFAGRFSSF